MATKDFSPCQTKVLFANRFTVMVRTIPYPFQIQILGSLQNNPTMRIETAKMHLYPHETVVFGLGTSTIDLSTPPLKLPLPNF